MHVDADETWALVLAAGEGSRLRSLTTSVTGVTIPKQFCSLHEGPSLLHKALRRARAVTDNSHTCAVVAEQHRRFWEPQLASLPAANIVVQPENRGTAIGILLPLLHILMRDPAAQIVLLPSDHYVCEEGVLDASLRDGIEQLRWRFDEVLLLGIKLEGPDAELGYIVPGSTDGRGALLVQRFVEKPALSHSRELIRSGGLWNAFIVAALGQALLALFRRRIPEVVEAIRAAVQSDLRSTGEARAVAELYESLPIIDFSRDILSGQEEHLRVLPVPQCGWSDLGTPKRVAEALKRAPQLEFVRGACAAGMGYLSLAAQHERLSMEPAR
jgi:mannose-1-phosphate guanylyltransferase